MEELQYEAQRQQYRELLEDLQDKADSSGAHGVDPDVLRLLMMQGNELFVKVRRPREAALDAQFMKQVSALATLNIRSTHASLHEFKPMEFAEKVEAYLTRERSRKGSKALTEEHFRKVGRLSSRSVRKVHGLEPQLTGFVTKAPKPPVVRQPRPKDKEVARTQMKQVSSSRGEEVQTEEVSRIYQVLKRRFKENSNQPLCFFTFVINPDSFVLTIENVFHTSFLIRDQHALITQDADGCPLIAPDKPGTAGQQTSSKQIEVSFDVATFNECIEAFGISGAMIPPRQ